MFFLFSTHRPDTCTRPTALGFVCFQQRNTRNAETPSLRCVCMATVTDQAGGPLPALVRWYPSGTNFAESKRQNGRPTSRDLDPEVVRPSSVSAVSFMMRGRPHRKDTDLGNWTSCMAVATAAAIAAPALCF